MQNSPDLSLRCLCLLWTFLMPSHGKPTLGIWILQRKHLLWSWSLSYLTLITLELIPVHKVMYRTQRCQATADPMAWLSSAWLLLSISPFPVRHCLYIPFPSSESNNLATFPQTCAGVFWSRTRKWKWSDFSFLLLLSLSVCIRAKKCGGWKEGRRDRWIRSRIDGRGP